MEAALIFRLSLTFTSNRCYNRSLTDVVPQILWCFYRLWGADISVLSQVVILSVYEKKNGTDEIWCSCSPGIPLGFWAKILWSRGFTKILESQLHGSRRKSYLSAPFFFYLRYGWLVRGRLYMPNLHCELHHRICNLRYGTHGYGMSAYEITAKFSQLQVI